MFASRILSKIRCILILPLVYEDVHPKDSEDKSVYDAISQHDKYDASLKSKVTVSFFRGFLPSNPA